jgi:hypothetical protein
VPERRFYPVLATGVRVQETGLDRIGRARQNLDNTHAQIELHRDRQGVEARSKVADGGWNAELSAF